MNFRSSFAASRSESESIGPSNCTGCFGPMALNFAGGSIQSHLYGGLPALSLIDSVHTYIIGLSAGVFP